MSPLVFWEILKEASTHQKRKATLEKVRAVAKFPTRLRARHKLSASQLSYRCFSLTAPSEAHDHFKPSSYFVHVFV